jgi:hypothetical protein
MAEEVFKMLTVVLISTVKHTLGGIPLASGFGYSYPLVVLSTFIGGAIGVLVFHYVAHVTRQTWHKYRVQHRQAHPRRRKIFTKRNRLIVHVKQRFGLPGIAFLTPFFLSIPVGVSVATALYHGHKRILTAMCLSVAFWSLFGAALARPIARYFHPAERTVSQTILRQQPTQQPAASTYHPRKSTIE